MIGELSDYSDYGIQEYGTTGWDADPNYTAQPTNTTHGTHRFHARTQDPSTGTWTTQDTWRGLLSQPQTLSRYTYVTNNPATLTDYLGYWPWDDWNWGEIGRVTTNVVAGAVIGAGITAAVVGAVGCAATVVCGIIAVGAAAVGGAVAGGIASTANYAQTTPYEERTPEGFRGSFVEGAVPGAIGGAAGPIAGSILGQVAPKVAPYIPRWLNPKTWKGTTPKSPAGQSLEQGTLRHLPAPATKNGGAASVRLGQVGEDAVRAKYSIGPKDSAFIGGRKRIFDGLNDEAVSEVKNVAYQAYSQQLKDSLTFAQQTGRRFDLYVRGTTTLSRPLLDAIARGEINLRFIP